MPTAESDVRRLASLQLCVACLEKYVRAAFHAQVVRLVMMRFNGHMAVSIVVVARESAMFSWLLCPAYQHTMIKTYMATDSRQRAPSASPEPHSRLEGN